MYWLFTEINVVDNIVIFVIIIGCILCELVAFYLCYKCGPLKGKLYYFEVLKKLHNIIADHGIAIILIIALIIIPLIVWIHETTMQGIIIYIYCIYNF